MNILCLSQLVANNTTIQQQKYLVTIRKMALDKETVVKVANCIVNKINNECYYILVLKLFILCDKCFTAEKNRKRANTPEKCLI